MSPAGIDATRRSLFYEKSLPGCGRNLDVHPGVSIYFPENLTLGADVTLGRGVIITARGDVAIGSDVLIGTYVVINSGSHIYTNASVPIRVQGHKTAPIIIEDNVWIGAHTTILAGVTIGKGAVVAAGSLVVRDVEPFTVVAGLPATLIMRRQ